VIDHNGVYHMFLSVVPGIFKDWNALRDIVYLTSTNLLQWKYESTLKLASDRVIDACVRQLPDGTWRMWYNMASLERYSCGKSAWKGLCFWPIGNGIGDEPWYA